MRTKPFALIGLTSLLALAPALCGAADASRGLWVGEVTLNAVNETVVGLNAANQTVAPDPAVTTPVSSPAHLRILLHVDNHGQVRLLKNVAVLPGPTNGASDAVLLTDPALYGRYAGSGKRLTAVAYDFGDAHAVTLLDQVAAAAATAAANGSNPTNAALQVTQAADPDQPYLAFVRGNSMGSAALGAALSAKIAATTRKGAGGTEAQVLADANSAATNDARVVAARALAVSNQAAAIFPDDRYVLAVDAVALAAAMGAASAANSNLTAVAVGDCATNAALLAVTNAANVPSLVSPAYKVFIGSASLSSSVTIAASAAAAAVRSASPGTSVADKTALARSAASKALSNGQIYAAADAVTMNEATLSGSLQPGGTLSGTLYLGANHPTNPFRHRRHPDHTTGYAITRGLTINFAPAAGTNTVQAVGFGVDRLTGTYREEISGLHKPLGAPARSLGLLTEGTITLSRVSLTGVLNQ